MKKLLFGLLFLFCLAGCGREQTMETVGDVWDVPAMGTPRKILVDLPEDAAAGALESDAGTIYMGQDYEILLETMEAGDLDGTLRQLCGKGKEELTVLEREQDGCRRYEFVWATTGETGEQVGRCAVLDDGSYHYCLTILSPADAQMSSGETVRKVLQSFAVSP